MSLAVVLLAGLNVWAAPGPSTPILRRQGISTLSSAQISTFKPYSFYASAAYCNPSVLSTWNCGVDCAANSAFKPTATGGDGNGTPFWYVGYDPSLNTVIVAHEGTNPAKILADLSDVNVVFTNLDSTLFPGIDSSIEVHDGFANVQASTAQDILSAVQQTLTQHNINSVTAVGHSLGAAVSLLDSVFLPLHIPGLHVAYIGYGLPRVGNQNFANYVDGNLGSFTRITNMKDPVPIVPGRFLGYHHPSNEVHISENGNWDVCPGQDNTSTQCSVGDVPSVLAGNVANHDGPYDGVQMGVAGCRSS